MKYAFFFTSFVCNTLYAADSIIGDLKLNQLGYGAGCILVETNSSARILMLADYGSSGRAQINGKNVALSVDDSDTMYKKPGDKVKEEYSYGHIKLRYIGVFISEYSPEGPLTDMSKGTLIIESGKTKESYPVIERCGKLPSRAVPK